MPADAAAGAIDVVMALDLNRLLRTTRNLKADGVQTKFAAAKAATR